MRKNKIKKICRKCGTSFKTLNNSVKYCSISCARKILFCHEDIKKIILMYRSGEGAKNIGKGFNCTADTILKLLRENNIAIRTVQQASILSGKNIRTYKVDENYFEEINTEEKAYWLGFIAADGNISKSSNTLYISLHRRDKTHLVKFLRNTMSNYKITDFYNSNLSEQSRISVTSHKMKSDLVGHGIIPNKSLTLVPPSFYNDTLEKAFWRGCIDGDGSICKRIIKNRTEWTISLVGSHGIVESFSRFINKNIGFNYSVVVTTHKE